MEKALYELNIDPELENLIPPLSQGDYESLVASINVEGCEEPLVVWNGTIVDGHNRYRICHLQNEPFEYREKEFENKEEVKKWMIQRSLGRRNLSKYDKAVLALKYEDVLKKEADIRKKSGVKIDLPPISAEGPQKGDTRDSLANMAGVGHNYIDRVKKIEEVADDDKELRIKVGAYECTISKLKETIDEAGTTECG